jgi:serine/threonine-protein kinase
MRGRGGGRVDGRAEGTYEFGPFLLETDQRRLFKNGEIVSVAPKVFETLIILIERRGRLVSKTELLAALWPSAIVEEGSLARNISDLRKILEERRGGNRYIETVAKIGYRWVAEVRVGEVRRENVQSKLLSRVRLLTLGAATVLVVVSIWQLWRLQDEPVRSVAVLPLRPLDSNSHEERLEVGLTDSLITQLSGLVNIPVRPTTSVLRYLRAPVDPLAAGRDLKADAILDTSLLKSGDHVRVTARLLRVKDGRALWTGSFDEKREALSRIESAISSQLSVKLNGIALAASRTSIQHGPEYEDYLKGLYFWSQRTRASVRKSVDYFQRAIDTDPSYALAYVGLANAYLFEAGMDVPSRQVIPLARSAAERAIQLDPSLAEPHASLGLIAQNHELNWDKADSEYRKARDLNPQYALARHWYAEFLGHLGKFEESAKEFEEARRLDPVSPAIVNDEAKIDLYARNFKAAVTHSREAIELDPHFYLAHVFLSYALAKLGRCHEALDEHRQAAQLDNSAYVASTLVWIESVCGERQAAQSAMAELLERSNRDWVAPLNMGLAYASLGDSINALDWFDKAIEDPARIFLGLSWHHK